MRTILKLAAVWTGVAAAQTKVAASAKAHLTVTRRHLCRGEISPFQCGQFIEYCLATFRRYAPHAGRYPLSIRSDSDYEPGRFAAGHDAHALGGRAAACPLRRESGRPAPEVDHHLTALAPLAA